jgi:hypothetical protein
LFLAAPAVHALPQEVIVQRHDAEFPAVSSPSLAVLPNGSLLADSLNNYLNSIDWFPPNASEDEFTTQIQAKTIQFGIIFSRFSTSAYDNAVNYYQERSDWIDVLLVKRLAELSGYNSQNLVLAVVQALENMSMVGDLPKTTEQWNGQYYEGFFSVHYRFLLHAYRWAEQVSGDINRDGRVDILDAITLSNAFLSIRSNCDLNGDGMVNRFDSSILANNFGQNGLMSKWNGTSAFQQLAGLVDKYGGGFLYAGVDTVVPFPDPQNLTMIQYNCRYYDEEAETLGCFHIFEEDGLLDARNYEDKIWSHLNNDGWWSGQWYWYRPNWKLFECEMGRFAIEITQYLGGYVHPNIASDLNQKLVLNEWNSSCWQPWCYVVNHANDPDGSVVSRQARPEDTLAVWEALESFYTSFPIEMQNAINDMLTKEPKAWKQVSSQPCYTKAQLDGAMLMFLNGIVPEGGSLHDSLTQESYESCELNFPASQYRFDYINRMIRIPTTSGKIAFQFGTQMISYNFTQGVWDIYFSNDWNSIESVVSAKLS